MPKQQPSLNPQPENLDMSSGIRESTEALFEDRVEGLRKPTDPNAPIKFISERRERKYRGMNAAQYRAYLERVGAVEYIPAFETAVRIAEAVKAKGGRALLVGGSVRDEFLGQTVKDYDLEVYGLAPNTLKELLATFGDLKETGEAFTVLKLRVSGVELDISLPRRESKTGKGHRDFSISADPQMSIKEAAQRRDFTMNSMAKDILTGEIFDYFAGAVDLRQRVLRMTDEERFTDDPLRVLRAMQFVGRFGLMTHDRASYVMRTIREELKHLSKERLREEWLKLLLRSPKPSLGLNAAMEFGIFHALHITEIVPMLATPQEHEYHPEGDAWIHTMMVVDEAAKIIEQERMPEHDATIVLLAAFCHDLGKPSTTKIIKGKITSHGHEEAGAPPTEQFLAAIGVEEALRNPIKKLVAEHLKPTLLYLDEVKRGKPVSDGVIRRLATRLHPATIAQLVAVAKADHLGRGPFVNPLEPEKSFMPHDFPAGAWLLERAKRLLILDSKPEPVLMGRDLVALGLPQSTALGKILKLADRLRDEKGKTREDILFVIHERVAQGAPAVIVELEQLLR